MKSTARMFYGMAVFLLIMTVVYLLATMHVSDSGSIQGLEWAGTAGLALSTLLCLMLGGYFDITERKSDILPSEWEEAKVADSEGVLGFFSASSIWPFVMAFSIMLMGYALAFLAWWLLVVGALLLVFSTIKLNLQYITPPEKH